MNQIKSLKLKIKNSSMLLEQKRIVYHKSKKAMHQNYKSMLPLLCLGAFAATFSWAWERKFPYSLFKLGKNIMKIIRFS